MRRALVEVLFDYRPAEWYAPAAVSTPPPRRAASAEARLELRAIGELVLRQGGLDDTLRTAVERTLDELRRNGS